MVEINDAGLKIVKDKTIDPDEYGIKQFLAGDVIFPPNYEMYGYVINKHKDNTSVLRIDFSGIYEDLPVSIDRSFTPFFLQKIDPKTVDNHTGNEFTFCPTISSLIFLETDKDG